MMELKRYQRDVLDDIEAYLVSLDKTSGINAAWREYWAERGMGGGGRGATALPVGIPSYKDDLGGVPNVCIKVPTGGGKTFLAASSVKTIFDRLPTGKSKFVVWLVPSDAILTQTVANLSNPNHPYRQRLNRDFGGAVNVYTKEQLLNAQNFKPTDVMENLSVCVFCYASIRANPTKKDDKKIYQENGNLIAFSEYFNDRELLLTDTPETALMQVVRQMNPVVVVDESHNAKSELSIAMLKNLNPSFVLSMTATPTERSNIISYANARELKRENMVKLPVIVYNRPDRASVIHDAVKLRGVLEKKAKAEQASGGSHIRPIVLFQAQPKNSDDAATFDMIKSKLVNMGIPAEEIAIKTANKDELKTIDLMAKSCPIRYIITVNALKEGWDCPFAYILASLANKTSTVDVEQIVGRILRQPYARRHSDPLLNMSFVLASSGDFQTTVRSVVEGLNGAGFSASDYRVADVGDDFNAETQSRGDVGRAGDPQPAEEDLFDDIPNDGLLSLRGVSESGSSENCSEKDTSLQDSKTPSSESKWAEEIINVAVNQGTAYEAEVNKSSEDLHELGGFNVKNQHMQPQFAAEAAQLKIPQFMLQDDAGLFGGTDALVRLSEADLMDGFTLAAKAADIDFNPGLTGAMKIDISESGDVTPKCKSLSKADLNFLTSQLAGKTGAERLRHLIDLAATQLDLRIDFCDKAEIADYVKRVATQLPPAVQDQLSIELLPAFTQCVRDKIDALAREHKHSAFQSRLNANTILCEPFYELPSAIQPPNAITYIEKSLYTGEYDDMNGDELKVVQEIAAKDNVRWWHRIKDRKGFCINGFINHYPDFMVMTDKGTLVMVEVKGPHLDGSDSQVKAELGRIWADNAGLKYKYFMVFLKDGDAVQGALKVDAFLNTLEKL